MLAANIDGLHEATGIAVVLFEPAGEEIVLRLGHDCAIEAICIVISEPRVERTIPIEPIEDCAIFCGKIFGFHFRFSRLFAC